MAPRPGVLDESQPSNSSNRNQSSIPSQINPSQLSAQQIAQLRQLGIPIDDYYLQRAEAQSTIAQNRALAELLGNAGGGGGGSNPLLDALARQGVVIDREMYQALSELAGKQFQNQNAQFDLQGNQIHQQEQLAGLDQQQLGLDRQGLEDALAALGIDRQQIELNRQNIGVDRTSATQKQFQESQAIQSEATGRGATQSRLHGIRQQGTQDELFNSLQQLGLQEQGLGLDSQRLDYKSKDINRGLEGNQLQGQALAVKLAQLSTAFKKIGLDREAAALSSYADMARLNNQLGALDLREQGIGVGGGGGGSNPYALQAQQYLIQNSKLGSDLQALDQSLIGQISGANFGSLVQPSNQASTPYSSGYAYNPNNVANIPGMGHGSGSQNIPWTQPVNPTPASSRTTPGLNSNNLGGNIIPGSFGN